MYNALRNLAYFVLLLATVALATTRMTYAAPAKGVDEEATKALNALYESTPAAKALGDKAKAVLVFPNVRRGALLVGGQGGHGAMFKDGKIVGHYNIGGVVAGLEAGAQTFSYAVFFMSDAAMQRLNSAKGFELGIEPNIVVLNAGAAANISTTTAQHDVYAYVYDVSGLMGGISLQGLKISKLSN